jgi:hypothetical protein
MSRKDAELIEGPEGGKMGTGICSFFGWENEISCWDWDSSTKKQ